MMNSPLRRVDYAQVGTTSARCLRIVKGGDGDDLSARSKGSSKKQKTQRDRVSRSAIYGIVA